jgi:hypothetical protein
LDKLGNRIAVVPIMPQGIYGLKVRLMVFVNSRQAAAIGATSFPWLSAVATGSKECAPRRLTMNIQLQIQLTFG